MSIFIIAEAGVNHNGSLARARKMVEVAAKAGADAIKFQTFSAENVVVKGAAKAAYQKKTTPGDETQFAMIKKLELDARAHFKLAAYCRRKRIIFLSTPFDLPGVELLKRLKVPFFKVSSGDVTNFPLIFNMAKTRLPLILSTGMSTPQEVKEALGVIALAYMNPSCLKPDRTLWRKAFASREGKRFLKRKVTLLQCTTEYPAPFSDVNLRAMDTLHREFGLPVGLSDHTVGFHVAIAAAARGATIIEKHLTLAKELPGPDHKASLEPFEFRQMVQSIREVEDALGSSQKKVAASEKKNKVVARRSLVAARAIHAGETFTTDNMVAKRPGNGTSPAFYWQLLGRTARWDLARDEALSISCVISRKEQ